MRILPIIGLTILVGCGVKSPPVPPEGTSIPSVLEKHKGPSAQEKDNEEAAKKEDN